MKTQVKKTIYLED